ncbi:hypothetical protein [Desulfonatronovibrio magnus]|uniref:hypothetical protein n=1 Tax=Desulfonatronovibrio magnus TaxID=698827 RepID=UPI0005EBB087|nr:hypothetical protein [Desulfonatronovibrio magnus]RQD65473.1 MAG: hypothetical protein D5R98_03280 [Desulfonatronovibrio sp. MSAO_Bac4]
MEIQAGLGMAGMMNALESQGMGAQLINQTVNNQNAQQGAQVAQNAQAQASDNAPARGASGQGELINKIV